MSSTLNLSELCHETVNHPTFVGAPHLLDHAEWLSSSNRHETNLEYLCFPDNSDPELEPSAEIRAIGRVAEENCKLKPCGGWQPSWTSPFEKLKVQFILAPPRHRDLLPAWDNVLEGINAIQRHGCSHVQDIQNQIPVILENSANKDKGLKIRHFLFQRCAPFSAPSTDHASSADTESSTKWNADNWPCESIAARQQLQELMQDGAYTPLPFDAYDTDGTPISPANWQDKLFGADVLLKFAVCHQWFGKSSNNTKKDNFYAEIVEIRVLRTARLAALSPQKRKRTNDSGDHDDFTAGPSTKRVSRSSGKRPATA